MDRKMGTTDGTLEKIVENTTQNQEQGGKQDVWKLGNHTFTSRFILGSGKYSLELIRAAVERAQAQIVTLALRRVNEGGMANILDYIPDNVTLLPNTSGARNAEEAVRIARLSREVCGSDLVKIEIRYPVSPSGQSGDRESHGNSGERRIYGNAIYVPGSEYRAGSGGGRRGMCDASGSADRFQQRAVYEGIYPDPGG